MSRPGAARLALALCAGLVAAGSAARAQDDDEEASGFARTPPRLAFTNGEVSFWRSGSEEWTPARVNTALAAGDELRTDAGANLELQVGGSAFVRAGEKTQLGVLSLGSDGLRLRLTAGTVSFDLRGPEPGPVLWLETPNAEFRVEASGYYRVEATGDTTVFTSHEGGARVTPALALPEAIPANVQLTLTGGDPPELAFGAPAALDDWDRWNTTRTDDLLASVSGRYVSPEVYGARDLDRYGDWREVPRYGAVWIPRVRVGWTPYGAGVWLTDPWFGWTWVDDAPWGWAPFHYGRWVYVSGYWAWCPGPLVVRPYYAPALVAFVPAGAYPAGRVGVPGVGWLPLGWGEPLVPWWGPQRFRRHAYWAGWGGPRIVNQSLVRHGAVFPASAITRHQNLGVGGALRSDPFALRSVLGTGRGPVVLTPGRAQPDGWRGARPGVPTPPRGTGIGPMRAPRGIAR